MVAKTKVQICYRGSLKSCNYSCSYCPFSKRKSSAKELQQDRKALFRFVESIEGPYGHVQAVQIVPYGEALLHDYYWEALARLSVTGKMQAVGAQTNGSFPVEKKLKIYDLAGGNFSKLRLWLSFHPSMTSIEDFLKQCQALEENSILYCVGAVGIMENLPLIQQLREKLPEYIYLWINKLDTVKYGTAYKPALDEVEAFSKVDPYYPLECRHYPVKPQFCREYAFVEADGSVKSCNISQSVWGNWYQDEGEEEIEEINCRKKECNCFLAYCRQRDDEKLRDFGPYPMFRLPASYLSKRR